MTKTTRALALLVLVAATPVAPAHAQAAPPDPLESAAIRVGPLGINPSLVLRDFGQDDNVFNEAVNPKSDFTFTVTPRADVMFHPRGLRLSLTTASDIVYYRTYTSERSTNALLEAHVETDLWRLQPFFTISGQDTRERYNHEIDARARHRDRGYEGGLKVRLSPRTTARAAARRNILRFDPRDFRGVDLAATMNSRLDVVESSFVFEATPITSVSVAISDERQRFDTAVERDSDTLRVTPTVTFTPGGLLSGSASVGYRRFRPRTAALPAYSGMVAAINVGTTVYDRNRIEGSVSRDLRYSYETDTPYYLATGGTLSWTVKIAGPMDVRATGTRQVMEYRQHAGQLIGALPNDMYTAYGGGVGYTLRDSMRVGFNVEWSRRISDISGAREYRNRRIFASLTWGRPLP